MATHLRENLSIDAVSDIVDALCAALHADSVTAELSPMWTALSARADELAKERQTLERAKRRARAKLSVADSLWDKAISAFGRAVVDATSGRRDQAPYTRFFAKSAPSVVQTFGAQREVDQARDWIAELKRNPEEPLAKGWSEPLTRATDALAAAVEERNQSARAAAPLQTTIQLFLDDVNRELDRLEGQLMQLFAGDTSRVTAFLSPTRSRRSVSDDADELLTGEPVPAQS
jgi:hypothetical protein